jgi:hypothetical protein
MENLWRDKENYIKIIIIIIIIIIIPLLGKRVEGKTAWEMSINVITCNTSAQNRELIVNWVVKEHIFKMQNVGKHHGSQTAGRCEHCDEHKAK